MGLISALFSVSDSQLQALYNRAWIEADRGFVDPYDYPYLDRAIYIYAREHDCTYDDAYVFAKTGMKIGRLAENQ